MRRLLLVLVAAAALLAALPAAAQARLSALRDCDVPGFRCATLTVPLDRAGATPGTLRLPVAVQDGWRRGRRVLLALSGGPGQPGVPFAGAFEASLEPYLRASREPLVVLDQRGTGRAALRCPRLQRLRALGAFRPGVVEACLRSLGPGRRHFTTADTVDDLEALRAALGAPQVSLAGVSYGTYVAQQYARTHPARTRRLVLDSVLAPGGWDGFFLETYGALARVLRETCGSRCATDPVADLAAVAARAAGDGLRARVVDARGRARVVRRRLGEELLWALLAGDLNAELGALLPAALASAARGDDAPLLRLLPVADGPATAAEDLSAALLVATDCADARLPYDLASPVGSRAGAIDAALAAIAPQRYAPFPAAVVRAASLADDCSRWPAEAVRRPSTAPLPDVPALLLAGRLDVRTPAESARAVAAELPRATVVEVPGAGHDVTGAGARCVRQALSRFARGAAVGRPCAREVAGVPVAAPVPAVLADVAPARGVPGLRGRVLAAAVRAVDDAQRLVFAEQAAGLDGRGGCLRAGRVAPDGGDVRLTGCAAVPGVRVDGRIAGEDLSWRVRVRGPRGTSGSLRGTYAGEVRGTLGGRAVRLTRSSRTAAASPAPAPPSARRRPAAGPVAGPWRPPRTRGR